MTAVKITVKVTGMPNAFTDREAMAEIGDAVKVLIVRRTLSGKDAAGAAFKAYSTRPISIPTGSGRPLAPKGGALSADGKSMFFEGGYAEYKRRSRGPGQRPSVPSPAASTGEVDLVLSGDLMRSIKVLPPTKSDEVVVRTDSSTAAYAGPVNALREFMGLAPDDMRLLSDEATEAVRRAIARLYGP